MSASESRGSCEPTLGQHGDLSHTSFGDSIFHPQSTSHSAASLRTESLPDYETVHCSGDIYHTKPSTSYIGRLYRNGWGLETLGLLVSISAFIGLAVVLKRVNNQPLSTWTFSLSINTVVSTLSIIMKTPLAFMVGSCIGQSKWSWFHKRSGTLSAFVAFDEASRGPLGCMTLLWRLKSCHWVSLGAWVTLALLAFDPFFQAVINYEGRLDSTQALNAEVSRASFLDFGDVISDTTAFANYNGFELHSCTLYPDVGVSATSLIGFINSSTANPDQPPLISCKTGNCTWPLFSTVGICSRCADVSEHIIVEHKTGMPDENPFSAWHDSSATIVLNYTNYVLPYKAGRRLLLQFPDGDFNGSVATSHLKRISKVDVVPVYRPNETYSFKDSGTLLASFGIISAENAYWNNQVSWERAKITANECTLEFCGQIFQASSNEGIFDEQIISADFRRVESSFQPLTSDALLLKYIEQDLGNSLGYPGQEAYAQMPSSQTSSIESRVLAIPRSDLELGLANNTDIPSDVQRTFNISQNSILTLSNFFTQSSTLESITRSLSDSTNITTTFQTAARLLTNHFREVNNDPVKGTTRQWLVYVRVTWMYFGFPIVILVIGLIFSFGTMYESHQMRLEKMKSDALAMLLHGLDGDTREILRDEKTQGRILDNVILRLEQENNGPNLRSGD